MRKLTVHNSDGSAAYTASGKTRTEALQMLLPQLPDQFDKACAGSAVLAAPQERFPMAGGRYLTIRLLADEA